MFVYNNALYAFKLSFPAKKENIHLYIKAFYDVLEKHNVRLVNKPNEFYVNEEKFRIFEDEKEEIENNLNNKKLKEMKTIYVVSKGGILDWNTEEFEKREHINKNDFYYEDNESSNYLQELSESEKDIISSPQKTIDNNNSYNNISNDSPKEIYFVEPEDTLRLPSPANIDICNNNLTGLIKKLPKINCASQTRFKLTDGILLPTNSSKVNKTNQIYSKGLDNHIYKERRKSSIQLALGCNNPIPDTFKETAISFTSDTLNFINSLEYYDIPILPSPVIENELNPSTEKELRENIAKLFEVIFNQEQMKKNESHYLKYYYLALARASYFIKDFYDENIVKTSLYITNILYSILEYNIDRRKMFVTYRRYLRVGKRLLGIYNLGIKDLIYLKEFRMNAYTLNRLNKTEYNEMVNYLKGEIHGKIKQINKSIQQFKKINNWTNERLSDIVDSCPDEEHIQGNRGKILSFNADRN